MTFNGWEYGIAIGVLAILMPMFTGIVAWVIKRSLDNAAKAQKDVAEAALKVAEANRAQYQQQYEELKGIVLRLNQAVLDTLKERDRVCSTDHDKLVEEMHRLNTHLSELTGMLTFILDHYVKNNGSK